MAVPSSATPTNAPPMPCALVPTVGKVCACATEGRSPRRATNNGKMRVILFIAVSLAGNFWSKSDVLRVRYNHSSQGRYRLVGKHQIFLTNEYDQQRCPERNDACADERVRTVYRHHHRTAGDLRERRGTSQVAGGAGARCGRIGGPVWRLAFCAGRPP